MELACAARVASSPPPFVLLPGFRVSPTPGGEGREIQPRERLKRGLIFLAVRGGGPAGSVRRSMKLSQPGCVRAIERFSPRPVASHACESPSGRLALSQARVCALLEKLQKTPEPQRGGASQAQGCFPIGLTLRRLSGKVSSSFLGPPRGGAILMRWPLRVAGWEKNLSD